MNKKQKPLTLSIIIPIYNEENYIRACLECIAKQREAPDEVIAVDNNSTDESAKIAREFPFVKLIKEPNQGIVYARSAGFDKASSQIIARIDADTQIPPSWVSDIKRLASRAASGDGFTGPCSFRKVPFPGVVFWFHRAVYFWTSRVLFGHQVLFGSNMFLFRSNWLKIRQTVCMDNSIHEDMDLAHHIVQNGGNIHFDRELIASISPRRFRKSAKYPMMWLKTWLTHLRFGRSA